MCASMESRLFTVKDIDRFHLLQTVFRGGLWVGLDDMVTKGVYVWSDGQLFDGNTTDMFLPGEPNDYGRAEDCISMQPPKPYKLNDDACYKKFHSVCEKTM
ncbi:unnamed protein product [Candidula unifasciata]|uniref:C-type lectin domain-containing protein n=1 Tax=Candidula unifasciata TaxID=100452 RepID=A0A8S3YRN4_9EUPU|nr:unnamed protein product [Candidula unifasciata]